MSLRSAAACLSVFVCKKKRELNENTFVSFCFDMFLFASIFTLCCCSERMREDDDEASNDDDDNNNNNNNNNNDKSSSNNRKKDRKNE